MDAEIVSVPARPARHPALAGAALPEPSGPFPELHYRLGSTSGPGPVLLPTCSPGARPLVLRMRADLRGDS